MWLSPLVSQLRQSNPILPYICLGTLCFNSYCHFQWDLFVITTCVVSFSKEACYSHSVWKELFMVGTCYELWQKIFSINHFPVEFFLLCPPCLFVPGFGTSAAGFQRAVAKYRLSAMLYRGRSCYWPLISSCTCILIPSSSLQYWKKKGHRCLFPISSTILVFIYLLFFWRRYGEGTACESNTLLKRTCLRQGDNLAKASYVMIY